ncbi:DUF1654 domain-containing protein [Pseudomonas yamanorum]|uniref:DUF1654 domain-containing protein n=1 Tax=Pseudomonas yamanorum TaxID=515393 RepID=UPI002ED0BC96|nr:DUF1654 domain-containing protein [Pseudomonas yamanorum]
MLRSNLNKPKHAYELMARRLQRLMEKAEEQKEYSITISRLAHEDPKDWLDLLDEIMETDGVTLNFLEGGGVRLSWIEPDIV